MAKVFTNQIVVEDDSWERSILALKVLKISLDALQERKPDERKEPEKFKLWFPEYRELQALYQQQHYRRINLVMEMKKQKRKIHET